MPDVVGVIDAGDDAGDDAAADHEVILPISQRDDSVERQQIDEVGERSALNLARAEQRARRMWKRNQALAVLFVLWVNDIPPLRTCPITRPPRRPRALPAPARVLICQ